MANKKTKRIPSPPIVLESGIVKTPSGREVYRVLVQSSEDIPTVKPKKKKPIASALKRIKR